MTDVNGLTAVSMKFILNYLRIGENDFFLSGIGLTRRGHNYIP